MSSSGNADLPVAILYESVIGATEMIAHEVAAGMGRHARVAVSSVHERLDDSLPSFGLVVLGAPTFGRGLSTPAGRSIAALVTAVPGASLHSHGCTAVGMAEWLEHREFPARCVFAAFDVRLRSPHVTLGSAAKEIADRITSAARLLIVPPRTFPVRDLHRIDSGERERARRWGRQLIECVDPTWAGPALGRAIRTV
jgi:flavorubredoxin